MLFRSTSGYHTATTFGKTIIENTADNAMSLRVQAKCESVLPALRAALTWLALKLALAKSQGLDSEKAKLPKKANMLEWIKATAKAEGGAGALSYFTDDVINAGIKL